MRVLSLVPIFVLALGPAVQAAAQTCAPQANASAALNPRQGTVPLDLCGRIARMTQEPAVARAHWGISVAAADGAELCSLNALQLFRPASANKIFTSAAALALLGPAHSVNTQLVVHGRVQGDTITGDLRLIGAGDGNLGASDVPYVEPSLETNAESEPAPDRPPPASPPEPATIPDIETLADQVSARGIRFITGDVLGDDTVFAWQPYPPEWSAEDLLYGYGAPVSGLSLHDNEVLVRVVRPAAPPTIGTPGVGAASANVPSGTSAAGVTLQVSPAVPWFTFENDVALGASGRQSCGAAVSFEQALGSRAVKIAGALPPRVVHCSETLAISDPAEYTALALKFALERRGVQVGGAARALHRTPSLPGGILAKQGEEDALLQAIFEQTAPTPVACPGGSPAGSTTPPPGSVLATHTSPALLADVIFTLKSSQNLHAELWLRDLGATFSCSGTERASLHVLRQYLLHAGVEPGDFVLYDGSGLSGHDLVAPRAFTTFLSFAARQPWFSAWRAALPVGGVDGTLRKRFSGRLKGRVFAKTGTLGESRALAGYVLTDAGQIRTFAVMVDNHTPLNTADRSVMDRIVGAICEDGPPSSP